MPGKHAPDSPASFYWSLARAATGAAAALGLVVAIVLVAVNSRDGSPAATPTETGTGRATPTQVRTTEPTDEPTTVTSPTEEQLVPRARIRVDVLNGTDTAGLAADTAEDIRSEGYERILVGNADADGRPYRTTIFYEEGFEDEAQRLLADVPSLLRIRPKRATTQGEGNLTVILGDDYEA